MYTKEKQEKKNAEIAFKRILDKMYNEEKYAPNDIPKVFSYHSKPTSPEPKMPKSGKKRGMKTMMSGFDLATIDYNIKPMSPPNVRNSSNNYR